MKTKHILLALLISSVTPILSAFATEPVIFSGIVASHNHVRAKHLQKPLTWSDSLASYAQQWVNNLATTQNCSMIHRPNSKKGKFRQVYGENLFWASAEELPDGTSLQQQISTEHVVNAWAEEENFYDYQTNRCKVGEDCGHYTQMVWHESQQVGCALAICADKSQIWACNYHPRGNYLGEWPY